MPPARHGEWQALNQRSPDGSIYSDPAYLEALCAATGATFRVLGLVCGGKLEGGVALYERSQAAGRYVAPRLLLYYSGPVLARHDTTYPSEQTARHLDAMGVLARHLPAMGYGSIVLKGLPTITDVRPFIAAGWTAWPAYSYVVPLDDLPRQWQRVEQNLRRLVKRCTERDNISFAADDDFEAFHCLHETTLTRKSATLYLPKPEFAAFFERLRAQGLARIFHARLPDGRPIATQLVLLGPYATSHSVCAGGDPEFAKLGAQAFLRWRVFEHLAGLGYASNDLTDAALNSITHFKSQFGGNLVTSYVLAAQRTVRSRRCCVARNRCDPRPRAPPGPRSAAMSEATGVDAATIVCRTLSQLGARYVFGVPGTQSTAFYEALRRSGLRAIVPTHELAATFMAGAYHRAGGGPGILTTIPGPGLAEARLDSAAVVYFVNARDGRAKSGDGPQAIDQRALLAPVTKAVLGVRDLADVAETVRRGWALAQSGEPGPVAIELGGDTDATIETVSAPRSDAIAAAWQRIAAAKKPVLLAGQGALGAADNLRALAERLHAPILTTPSARGIVSEASHLSMGFDVLKGTLAAANALLARADLVLVIGAKLAHNGSAGSGLTIPHDITIRIDTSAEALRETYPASLTLEMEAGAFLAAAAARANTRSHWSNAEIAAARAAISAPLPQAEPLVAGSDPATFFAALANALPAGIRFVTDTGQHQVMTRRHLPVITPRGLLIPSDFQSMGFGLPAAIAASLAEPLRPTVALIGDGGLRMMGFEIATARSARATSAVRGLFGSRTTARLKALITGR